MTVKNATQLLMMAIGSWQRNGSCETYDAMIAAINDLIKAAKESE